MKSKRTHLHAGFIILSLALFAMQPISTPEGALFGLLLFLISVYTGRWISTQAARATWVDMFRMFFLSFFTLSFGGLAVFAVFVEQDLPIMHYLESLINIACFSCAALLAGYYAHRIRKKITANASAKKAIDGAHHQH